MGYAKVFWIQEQPIRRYVEATGHNDALSEEIGKQVLSLAVKRENTPLPLFDMPSVFTPFRSFHSTDFCVLFWSGSRLYALPDVSLVMFDLLCELASTIGTSHLLLSISKAEYHRAIGGGKWHNALEQSMYASLYYIYEDFTRDYERHSESDWPCKEVGEATLSLMLSNWSRSADIRNYGKVLSRCCSFARPECAVFVWSRNCMQLVSEIKPGEIERMRDYLASEQRK